ncbi:MAG: AAA family ATPase [Lachnospiraceae bacterium]|nr:AAA family ATPase [Lachnospiraceae bacterium]
MALKKLILISGSPCVGKSTVGKRIFEHYENSAFCDGDWCWCVNPLSIEDTRVRNGDRNMAYLVSNYLKSDFEYVVFASVVLTDPTARENILNNIDAEDYEVLSFQLTCTEDYLKPRHDERGLSDEVSFCWLQLPPYPGETVIDTDAKTPDQVCDEICRLIDSKKVKALKTVKKTASSKKATAKKTTAKKSASKAE